MQKKLIALAIAGIAAAPAFAQSNVTIYGRADAGYVSRSGSSGALNSNGTKSEIASGIGGGSRFGLRGTEDLGGGLKAIFQMEYNVTLEQGGISSTINGGANLASRNSWVGLTGGFGTVLVGRVDGARYGVATKYDPFGSGYVGNMASIQTHATRGDNAVAYVSPSFGGFKVLGAYTTALIGQETGSVGAQGAAAGGCPIPAANFAGSTNGTAPGASANQCDIRLWAIQPSYENGPISITLNFEGFKINKLSDSDGKIAVVGGSYDFGMVKLHGYWESIKTESNGAAPNTFNGYTDPGAGQDNMDQRSWMLGVTVPFGAHSVRASYVRLDDKTQQDAAGKQRTGDCNKFGLGYSYSLSKRTSMFADYARVNNKSNGTCTIAFSGATGSFDTNGAGPAGGFGNKGFDLGIAHTF